MSKSISIIWNWVYGCALAHLFGKKHAVKVFWRTQKREWEYLIDNFPESWSDADYIIISITTSALSQVYPVIAPHIQSRSHVILAMKWLTANSLLPIDECRLSTPDHHISILSGPGFADEIISDIPVHLVLASDSTLEEEQEDFLLDNLTLDWSHDVTGVSWCGILKNIYAIGAGIRSHDADWDRSHYTTAVVHEMSMILTVLGGVSETAIWPAWRGDVWICTTPHSRNFRYGASLDPSLRQGAEWYNAALHMSENYSDIMRSWDFPIIARIISQIQTS